MNDPRSSPGVRDRSRRDGLVLAAVAAIVSSFYAVRIRSWDFWWHLATGRWIVEHRAIPRVDPFSFTAAGQPWRDVNWLADLLLFGAHELGGPALVVGLKVVTAFSMLLALGAAMRVAGARRAAWIPCLLVVAVLVQPRYSMARPAAIGGAFAAAGALLCLRAYQREGRSAFWFVPLLLLWSATHASVLVGVVEAAVLFVATAVTQRRRSQLVSSGAALVVGVGLIVGTERGRDILYHAASYTEGSLVVQLTDEWRPVPWQSPAVWGFIALFAVALVGAALDVRRRPVIFGLAAAGALVGLRYLRHVPVGLILCAPALAVALDRALAWLEARRMTLARRLVPAAAVLGVIGGHAALGDAWPLSFPFGFAVDHERFPHDTLARLKELPFGRTLNDFALGGYLIWHRIPGGDFFDGRTVVVFTEEDVEEIYRPILESHEGLDRVADRFDVVYGLVTTGSAEAKVMMTHPAWLPLMHGQSTSLFVRRKSARPLVERGIRPTLVRWVDEEAFNRAYYSGILGDPRARRALRDDLARALTRGRLGQAEGGALVFLAPAYPRFVEEVRAAAAGRRRRP